MTYVMGPLLGDGLFYIIIVSFTSNAILFLL